LLAWSEKAQGCARKAQEWKERQEWKNKVKRRGGRC
jgi:hypothetical protein